MRPDDETFFGDADVEATDQVARAVENIYRPASDWIDWPFPDLNALCGRIAPKNVWFVNAFSGNGKTLFITSALQRWVAQGVKVYAMPLETDAEDFRQYMACQSLGIDPGYVNGGGMNDLSDIERLAMQKRIAAAVQSQVLDPHLRRTLRVKGVDSINLSRLALAYEEAKDWGARILLVDHIDHIDDGDGKNSYAESVRVNKGALRLSKQYDIATVFTSQLNLEAVKKEKSRLAQFGPPSPGHVYMGNHKRMIATGMIALHRRIRDRHEHETPEELRAAIAAAEKGDAEPMSALQPNVMAVTAMKLRNFGAREGKRCFLGVEHGYVTDLPERDRFSTTYDGQRRIA